MNSLIRELQDRFGEAYVELLDRPMLAAFVAVFILFHTLAWCRVFSKAGHSSAFGLLSLFPPMAIVLPFTLAFIKSPADRELRALRGIEKVMRKADHRIDRAA